MDNVKLLMLAENAKVVKDYCKTVFEYNAENGGKSWIYVSIAHDEVHLNFNFKYPIYNRVQYEQMEK